MFLLCVKTCGVYLNINVYAIISCTIPHKLLYKTVVDHFCCTSGLSVNFGITVMIKING